MLSFFCSLLVLLLWTFVNHAACAPLHQTCEQCSLPCSEASVLNQHTRVIVLLKCGSEESEKTYNVSSLFKDGEYFIQDCLQRNTPYEVKIYAHDDSAVSEPLHEKSEVYPDCDSDSKSRQSDPNGAAGMIVSNTLLILLTLVFLLLYRPG